jgi:tetratricopeptide (TPR) repeat protein
MRTISRITLVLTILATFMPSVRADQRDQRLDPLFVALADAPGVSEAAAIERNIWVIWSLRPDDRRANALMLKGVTEMSQSQMPAALDSFTRLTRLAPDFAEAWNKRATVLYLLGRLEESVIDVKRTLKLEPRHFGALSGLGLIYLAVGQPEIALKALDAALAIHPQMPGPREKAEQLRDDLKGRKL